MDASKLDEILKAISNVEASPASVEVLNSIFSEVKSNSKAYRFHLIHLSRIASTVYELKLEELYGLMDELMLEAGLLKTEDYLGFSKFFKDFSSSNVKSVSSPAFYVSNETSEPTLIRMGIVIDGETSKGEVSAGDESQLNSETVTSAVHAATSGDKVVAVPDNVYNKISNFISLSVKWVLKTLTNIWEYVVSLSVKISDWFKMFTNKTVTGFNELRKRVK